MLFTIKGKFSSSTAGLQLVLNTEENRTFSPLSYIYAHMVECFRAITIDAKHFTVHVGVCEQYCIVILSRNKSFPRNPFEFLHIRESLVSRSSRLDPRDSRLDPRDSRLDTRDSILERFEHRGLRIESRDSSFECQLTFERYCRISLVFRRKIKYQQG